MFGSLFSSKLVDFFSIPLLGTLKIALPLLCLTSADFLGSMSANRFTAIPFWFNIPKFWAFRLLLLLLLEEELRVVEGVGGLNKKLLDRPKKEQDCLLFELKSIFSSFFK